MSVLLKIQFIVKRCQIGKQRADLVHIQTESQHPLILSFDLQASLWSRILKVHQVFSGALTEHALWCISLTAATSTVNLIMMLENYLANHLSRGWLRSYMVYVGIIWQRLTLENDLKYFGEVWVWVMLNLSLSISFFSSLCSLKFKYILW